MKTKRIVALFLTVSMMLSFFSFFCFATETTDVDNQISDAFYQECQHMGSGAEVGVGSDKEFLSKNKGMTYSCVYDSSKKKIVINGSVTHDMFIAHRDFRINLYKISPEQTPQTVLSEADIAPLASTSISIKFNFTVEAGTVADIFSQYVIALVSKDGKIDYVGGKLFPSVKSEYVDKADRANYKGVTISASQEIFQTQPSVAVVPIYLNKLISSGSMGYLYSLEGTPLFFDREYIDSIDRIVRNLYSSGSKIYFQLLLPYGTNAKLNSTSSIAEAKTDAIYDIPDIFSISVMKEIYSYCDFLSDRYSSYKNGFIDGIILGKKLDDTEKYNNNCYDDEEEYTRALAHYAIVVGVATRKNIPYADISYSFTNKNTYGAKYKEDDSYQSSEMIETISSYFDRFYSDCFDFSITLESSHSPLSISNDMLDNGIHLSAEYDNKYIDEQNGNVFSDFLASLEKKYSSSPSNFIYIWNVDSELSGNALLCAYAYLYYKFFAQERLSAFVVGLEDNPEAVYDLINVIKYIDTDRGIESTSQLLHFFGEYSWEKIIYGFSTFNFATRKHKLVELISDIPDGTVGEFSYFDFSESSNYNSWFMGSGFKGMSMDYYSSLGRSLCLELDTKVLSQFEYAYLFNSYEYPENFKYTPYLDLALAIEDNDEMSDIFEVKVAFESSGSIYESSGIVRTGEITHLYFDISEFSYEYMVDNIILSVRPMLNTSGEYKLFISSLNGESELLDDDELRERINEERLRIRNSFENTDVEGNNRTDFLTAFMVLIIAIIICVMLFFFLRREETDE